MSDGMHGQYHKIPTLWKRESSKPHRLLVGEYSSPELEALSGLGWDWTEKVDGTNVRVGWDGNEVRFGGKTDRAQMQLNLVERLQELFGGEENAQVFEQTFGSETHAEGEPNLVTLYGEGYGAKIQKGGGNYNPDGCDFVLFDVKIGHWWLKQEDVDGIAEALGVRSVPIVGRGTLTELHEAVKAGFESEWGEQVTPEGLVARAPLGILTRGGKRLVCKLKGKDLENAVQISERF